MKTNLQSIRKDRGYKSAREFAESIGIPVGTYTNYEQGTRMIALDVACELCDALHCSLDELTGRVEYHVVSLENDEKRLVDANRELGDRERAALLDMAEKLAGKQ